tara:strand:- start:594 stop:851 length:258 start_codon:yes stop_codon:yes gene_type:complete
METNEWVKTREAEVLLCISDRTLLRLRKKKILPAGKCWRRTVPDNLNSHIVYHIPSCQEVLSGMTAALEMEQDGLSNSIKNETTI